ncbi:MAG: hypothetical protein EOO74_00920 [Myxococcales bacterium]|nr:MAG: hypothetical protein EOO74_00920 [Myxococcales bacterium]
MSPPDETITCPLCALPHLATAVLCDGCGQDLHAKVDWSKLHRECALRRQDMWLAGAATVAMVVASAMLVGTLGGAVLATAPLGWGFTSFLRYRALRQRLARLPAGT